VCSEFGDEVIRRRSSSLDICSRMRSMGQVAALFAWQRVELHPERSSAAKEKSRAAKTTATATTNPTTKYPLI
jgi:hypothetical protein